MQKKKKMIFAVLLSAILVVALTGCSKLGSIINEIHGSLIGNNYTVYTYDNYGNQTLKTSGKKISITGNKIILVQVICSLRYQQPLRDAQKSCIHMI